MPSAASAEPSRAPSLRALLRATPQEKERLGARCLVPSTLNEQPLLLGHPGDAQQAEGLPHHPALPGLLPAHTSPRRDGAAPGGRPRIPGCVTGPRSCTSRIHSEPDHVQRQPRGASVSECDCASVSVPPRRGCHRGSDSSLTRRRGTSGVTASSRSGEASGALPPATQRRHYPCRACCQLGGASQMFNSCTAALEARSRGRI